MRDKSRIPIVVQELQELWELVPDWRLTQLLRNIEIDPERDFNDEEEVVLRKIRTWKKTLIERPWMR